MYIEVKSNKLESGLSYCGVLLWHPYKLILSYTAKYCRQVLKVGLLMKCMTLHFCIVLWMSSRVTYSSLCSRFKSCLSCAAWFMFVLFALCIFFTVSSWPQEKKIVEDPRSASQCVFDGGSDTIWAFCRSFDVSTEPQNNFDDLSCQSNCKCIFGCRGTDLFFLISFPWDVEALCDVFVDTTLSILNLHSFQSRKAVSYLPSNSCAVHKC